MLSIYNTLTKQKEIFHPAAPGKINLYVCGMTVYDYCHIGHARSLIAFDVIVRFLRYLGCQVNYIRNITDIDDKIINRANENQESCSQLTERFIQAMHEDCEHLHLLKPDKEPRATDFMAEIIQLIKTLVDKGCAYKAENGDVYFNVRQFKEYGKLSRHDLDQLRQGVRIDVAEAKKDPLDFVLWKAEKPNEPNWDSPWGKGRPGWHIECSTMANCLADHIDIHGGGMDLLFPHHENEIAQSESATGKTFVNTWMHVGCLRVDEKKMSKSLGNFFTIREVLKKFDSEVVRYFMLSSQYRSAVNYSEEALQAAQNALERLYIALRDTEKVERDKDSEFEKHFIEAMSDDFNTPEALAVLFDISREINRLRDIHQGTSNKLASLLKHLGGVLGILQMDPNQFLQQGKGEFLKEEIKQIEALIQAREQARKNKNWAESDRIRNELEAMNIVLEDKVSETTWRRR